LAISKCHTLSVQLFESFLVTARRQAFRIFPDCLAWRQVFVNQRHLLARSDVELDQVKRKPLTEPYFIVYCQAAPGRHVACFGASDATNIDRCLIIISIKRAIDNNYFCRIDGGHFVSSPKIAN
jgi:hypothetical protein